MTDSPTRCTTTCQRVITPERAAENAAVNRADTGTRPTRPGLCPHCADRTREALGDLPDLYAALLGKLAPGQTGGERVSGSKERPLGVSVEVLSFIGPWTDDGQPMRLDLGGCRHALWATTCDRCPKPTEAADDLQIGQLPLADTLVTWCKTVAELRGLAFPERTPHWESRVPSGVWREVDRLQGDRLAQGWLPARVSRLLIPAMVAFLLPHHGWLAEHDGCVGYGEEIRRAAHHARTLAGMYDAKPELQVGVPCPRCEFMSLVRRPGHDIECARQPCQAVFRPAEFERWLKMYAEDRRSARRKFWMLDEEHPAAQADRMRVTADELDHDRSLRAIASGLRQRADELDLEAS